MGLSEEEDCFVEGTVVAARAGEGVNIIHYHAAFILNSLGFSVEFDKILFSDSRIDAIGLRFLFFFEFLILK